MNGELMLNRHKMLLLHLDVFLVYYTRKSPCTPINHHIITEFTCLYTTSSLLPAKEKTRNVW
jgi:hypothetical protein